VFIKYENTVAIKNATLLANIAAGNTACMKV
jgi:hypothetical protein